MTKDKPVVLMHGDEAAGECARKVQEILFPKFPFVEIDLGVESRIKTKDRCISIAAKAFSDYGSGIKISTASNNPKLKKLGVRSANVLLRSEVECIGIFRITFGPGRYFKPIGVARFGSGDFYCETGCDVTIKSNGDRVAVITQELNLDYLDIFVDAAYDRALEFGLHLIYSSKWTISNGESFLSDACKKAWTEKGLVEGDRSGSGTFYGDLTDMGAAYIPGNVALEEGSPMNAFDGGWMLVTGNANGDTMSDIADIQHGNKALGSEVVSRKGTSLWELPGGTAPDLYGTDYMEKNFFNPMSMLHAFTKAISAANPHLKDYCEHIMYTGFQYLHETDPSKRGTKDMLEFIKKFT
ncbi:hypothetical protein COB87_000555 [Candidatus Wolfebacteria bacterium]|nr:hypothetical protein [Candidatus Wolfebacteria bacterium]